MFPAFTPRDGANLSSIPYDVWNGYVPNSAVNVEPYARWPFGRAPRLRRDVRHPRRETATAY